MKEQFIGNKMIELLRSRDRKAVEQIYELYSPVLLAICMRYFKRRDVALDVMHEGFMKALESIHSYKNKGSFEGWLKRIIVNHSIDTLKKEKKYQYHDIEDIHVSDKEEEKDKRVDKKDINEKKIDVNFVRDAEFTTSEILEEIHKLPKLYAVVFVLFVLDELTHREIAEQLEIDEENSRTRLTRARQMVKKALYKRSITVLGK